MFAQRCGLLLLFLGIGCSAQTPTPYDVSHRIEQHLRLYFKLPDQVNVQLGARTPSELTDFDTLVVTLSDASHSQQVNVLISKDNKTLARFIKMDLTKDPYAEIMGKISLAQRPWRGKEDAKVVIVNFDDFQCPYCARMHQMLFGQIYPVYGDRVKIVYKDYPLDSIHPWASRAAVDSNCLAAQNNDSYWAFADTVHSSTRQIGTEGKPLPQQFEAVDAVAREQGRKFHLDMEKLDACLKSQDQTAVKASVQEAEQVGVEATPTAFVNGHKVAGAELDELRAAIERALRESATPSPAPSTAK